MTEKPFGDVDRLVDVHAHFLTPAYVEAAQAAGHQAPDGMPWWPGWEADEHLELMDKWGIEASLLSVSSPGTHFGDDTAARRLTREVNDAGAEIRRAHPGRFGHLASLPLPDVDGALTELVHALDELDCDGVIVETNVGGRYLGDAEFAPVWEELSRRRTPVLVHPTSPPHAETIALGRPRPMLEFPFETVRAVSDLVFTGAFQRYAGIQWIFTHGGGPLPLLADRIELFRSVLAPDGDPVTDQARNLWFDMAGTPFPHQVPALERAFGTQRLLYGSDYCWTPSFAVDAQVAAIDAADRPGEETWRALAARNGTRLFPRVTRRS
ncbi:amidohydrolase family protein [Streptomyces sp. NPDC093990]|uniref:amidohydrolase family protein n=1 Tax=Streptomyces sp. NPDC093990 TaxID=3155306 RepID=UPI00342CCF4E